MIHHRLGDEGSEAMIANNLGVVARQQGDDAGALTLLERSLAQQRRLGLSSAIPLFNLGDWALRRGEPAQAASIWRSSCGPGCAAASSAPLWRRWADWLDSRLPSKNQRCVGG